MSRNTKTHTYLKNIRSDFPALNQKVHGKPLVYFDNAASSQKPIQVIRAISEYYKKDHANVHRGLHYLSAHATEKYESVRDKVKEFINALHREEIIFTSGTTQGINMLAASFAKKYLHKGDEILISEMEHHSNLVPWQMVCEDRGATLKIIRVTEDGELDLDEMPLLINEKTKLLAITHVSNTLGTINPVEKIISIAHEKGIPVLLDGAQAVPHLKVDVQQIDCDFYVFSGHKMYGPTGTGVVYGKKRYLEEMPPVYGGGEMISSVTFQKTIYNELPYKFEAGTPNIGGVIGLGAAIEYLHKTGMERIKNQEQALLKEASNQLREIEGMRLIGVSKNKAAVISFLLDDIHPYDTGTLLDQMGIAVRTGHHCTEPLMERYKIPGTVRVSFAFYNSFEEINILTEGIKNVKTLLRK